MNFAVIAHPYKRRIDAPADGERSTGVRAEGRAATKTSVVTVRDTLDRHATQLSQSREMLNQKEATSMETFTNTDEPFLVMKPGRDQGRSSILLVNPTSDALTNVLVETGGFFSDDTMGVIESTAKDKTFETVAAGDWLEIEQPETEELQEFVVWWIVSFGWAARQKLHFGLHKGRDAVGCAAVPVVGGGGALIPRSNR